MSQQVMKRLFCQISKVDEEKRIVTGIGASEAVDFEGEIFDYASSKPYIESWSQDAYERTAAQDRPEAISYGNIREMHQPLAAGKLAEPIVFDDAQRVVILNSFISDDEAWKKCLDGTYTGFSICGPIVGKKWADEANPGVLRYTCAPIEFSICDLPCNPSAVFTAVKVGGITEERKFKTAAAVEMEAIVAKEVMVAKGLYQVGDLADILNSLRWLQADTAFESEVEGDNSPIPDKLKAWMAAGVEILIELAREEGSEAVAAMKSYLASKAMAKKATTKGLDAVSNCIKALNEVSGCMSGECDHKGIHKCVKAISDAHKTASEAIAYYADPDEDEEEEEEDSDADKAAAVAAGAAPITQQGESPENGEDEMDEATKAQLAAAEQNAAKALELAEKTNAGMEQIASALGKLTSIIAGEPAPAKSVASTAPVVVTKSQEIAGDPAAPNADSSPEAIAKSILAKPHMLSAQEASTLRIGR